MNFPATGIFKPCNQTINFLPEFFLIRASYVKIPAQEKLVSGQNAIWGSPTLYRTVIQYSQGGSNGLSTFSISAIND